MRSLIAINSSTTRAIRKILSTPGLSAAKVCILVGGPDWPTSVLTGILHLNPVSMVIGTLPVGFVIFAVTIAGACQLRRAEGGIWLSASSITLGIASAVTFVVLVASAYYIEETAEKHKDELDALPRDEEVEAADKEDEAKQAAFQRAIEWAPAPGWIKLNLVVALVLQILACYAAQFFGGCAPRCAASVPPDVLALRAPPNARSRARALDAQTRVRRCVRAWQAVFRLVCDDRLGRGDAGRGRWQPLPPARQGGNGRVRGLERADDSLWAMGQEAHALVCRPAESAGARRGRRRAVAIGGREEPQGMGPRPRAALAGLCP